MTSFYSFVWKFSMALYCKQNKDQTPLFFFLLKYSWFTKVLLVLAVQQSDTVIHLPVCLFFFRFFSLIDYYRIRIKLLLLHPRLFSTLIIILCSVSFDPISGLYLFSYFFRALNIMQTLSGPQLYKKFNKILLFFLIFFALSFVIF